MNGVAAESFGFPSADVADFAVGIVVPAGAGNGIGDGFTELVRGSGSECVGDGEAAFAAGAAGIRQDRVESVVASSVMITAKRVAGFAAALIDLCAGRKKNEVKSWQFLLEKCRRRFRLATFVGRWRR